MKITKIMVWLAENIKKENTDEERVQITISLKKN